MFEKNQTNQSFFLVLGLAFLLVGCVTTNEPRQYITEYGEGGYVLCEGEGSEKYGYFLPKPGVKRRNTRGYYQGRVTNIPTVKRDSPDEDGISIRRGFFGDGTGQASYYKDGFFYFHRNPDAKRTDPDWVKRHPESVNYYICS